MIPLLFGLGMLGLTLSYSVFEVVVQNREARLQNDFKLDINRRLAQLEQGLARSAEKLSSVSAFYQSSDEVNASKFRIFTSKYLRLRDSLDLLAWAPLQIEDNDLSDSVAESLLADTALPLTLIEPGPKPGFSFGEDILLIPGLPDAVEQSFQHGNVQAVLIDGQLILVVPTLDHVDWSGVALAVLPVATLAQWLSLNEKTASFEVTDIHSGSVILQTPERGIDRLAVESAVSFAEMTWRVRAAPLEEYPITLGAWANLAAGCAITGLFLIVILSLAGNTRRAEKMVQLRTRELEQAEAEARNQAIRLANEVAHSSQVIESIPSILIGIDGKEKITQWNKAIKNISGIEAKEIVGKTIAECGWQGDTAELSAAVTQCLAGNEMMRLEDLVFKKADGSEATLGMNIIPMRDSQDQRAGCLIIGADITDRNKMELQLRESQRLEAVGRLAAGIAHEVNTPAQFVSDNTTFLKEAFEDLLALDASYSAVLTELDEALSEDQKERITDARETADREFLLEEVPQALTQSMDGIGRIADIVRAMKEFSHPGGGGGKEQVDLNRLITNAITVAANEWKYHAEIETELDDELPPVACFPRELNQVVLNLIINAAHAIADRIGDTGERGKIRISTARAGNAIQMKLADTGSGIPEHVRDKIFEPFFTTKEVGRGSGQGLALAYSAVVEQHGGQLSFETEIGVGTTFTVELPLQTQEVTEEAIA
ncbi:MAG: PAS domain S-box protein [Gammaproteobacteria bacterium]|nr:PAS domain S-box protein [Gammaproteobacteria bacterium]